MAESLKKKVLFITHQLSRTGAPIVLLDVMKLYIERGFKVDVISMADGDLRSDIEELGISIGIQERFYPVKDAFRMVVEENYDEVWANTIVCYEAIYALNGSTVPVNWWIHEGDRYFEYFKTVIPDMANLCNNVTMYAVSKRVKNVIKRRFGIVVKELPMMVADYGKEERTQSKRIKFILIGTISSIKGQDILVEAIKKMPKDYLEKSKFFFCGNDAVADENILADVNELCENCENVTNLHMLARDEIMSTLKEMDVLLVPSRLDTMSTVAIEMMMTGGIVACSSNCGISDYIVDGQDGFVIPSCDSDRLCEKICWLIDNRDTFDKIGNSARKRYEMLFSKESMMQKIF